MRKNVHALARARAASVEDWQGGRAPVHVHVRMYLCPHGCQPQLQLEMLLQRCSMACGANTDHVPGCIERAAKRGRGSNPHGTSPIEPDRGPACLLALPETSC